MNEKIYSNPFSPVDIFPVVEQVEAENSSPELPQPEESSVDEESSEQNNDLISHLQAEYSKSDKSLPFEIFIKKQIEEVSSTASFEEKKAYNEIEHSLQKQILLLKQSEAQTEVSASGSSWYTLKNALNDRLSSFDNEKNKSQFINKILVNLKRHIDSVIPTLNFPSDFTGEDQELASQFIEKRFVNSINDYLDFGLPDQDIYQLLVEARNGSIKSNIEKSLSEDISYYRSLIGKTELITSSDIDSINLTSDNLDNHTKINQEVQPTIQNTPIEVIEDLPSTNQTIRDDSQTEDSMTLPVETSSAVPENNPESYEFKPQFELPKVNEDDLNDNNVNIVSPPINQEEPQNSIVTSPEPEQPQEKSDNSPETIKPEVEAIIESPAVETELIPDQSKIIDDTSEIEVHLVDAQVLSTELPDTLIVGESHNNETVSVEPDEINTIELPEIKTDLRAEANQAEIAEKEENKLTQKLKTIWNKFGGIAAKTLIIGGIASTLWPTTIQPFIDALETVRVESILTSNPEKYKYTLEERLHHLSDPIETSPTFDREDLILDKEYIHPDSILATSDIIRKIDLLTKQTFGEDSKPTNQLTDKYINTVKLLQSAKQVWPQATEFKLVENQGELILEPHNWNEEVRIEETKSFQTVIIGGELESIAAAIHAAKEQDNVAIVYSGPLGGLSSDSGANMRYFDSVCSQRSTKEQQEILHKALNMEQQNAWSLPDGITTKLENYLKENYPQINLIHSSSLDGVTVNKDGDHISSIVTPEGLQILGKAYLDTDPEAAISEKAGLPVSVETPNLAYGLVFDVKNINQHDLNLMLKNNLLEPKHIFKLCGIENAHQHLASHPELMVAVNKLNSSRRTSTAKNEHIRWGYQGLAHAFSLYMAINESISTGNLQSRYERLQKNRIVDGFNVAVHENSASFNSISYSFDKVVRQGRHNLKKDERFSDIREVEVPMLETFVQKILNKSSVKVNMPNQLYVRQSTLSVKTKDQYSVNEMSNPGHNNNQLKMEYPLDARGMQPRSAWDSRFNKTYDIAQQVRDKSGPRAIWNIDPRTTVTDVTNLFSVSKNTQNPDTMSATRIQQNLIGTAVTSIDAIINNKQLIPDKMQDYTAAYFNTTEPVQVVTDMVKVAGISSNLEDHQILQIPYKKEEDYIV